MALRLERELDAQSADVARALREDIGPQVTSLRTLAAAFESRLAGREPSLAPLASLMLHQADSLIESVRALVLRVRPDALSGGGLPEALRALAADWRLRKPGARVELLLDPPDDAGFGLSAPATETVALQVAAAVFERAFGAAGAGGVVLAGSVAGERLVLQSGRGVPGWFAAAESRIVAMGGEAQVEPGESGGTTVVVRLPWNRVSGIERGASPGAAGTNDAPV
jgi:glucose-6-phosphate-specific signal transduction histidine kinase